MTPPPHNRLTPEEETFLQAMLWEEGHLVKGQATRTAAEHGLSLIRALEPANRLSPNLHGQALNRLSAGPCPSARWPWPGKTGEEVLGLLWARLVSGGRQENAPLPLQ
jgi:hypothetical protein